MLFKKISVSIVVYKPNLQVLSKVISCLISSDLDNTALSVFVIDNSHDIEWHQKINCFINEFKLSPNIMIKLIKSPGNIGYGKANNLVLDKIDSDYHLVLNPDVFVSQDTLSNAINYMENNPNIGLLVPAIYSEDNIHQHLCKQNPTLLIMFLRGFCPTFIKNYFKNYIDKYEMKNADYDSVNKDIPFPSGCFMFFRTIIFKKLNGFDPSFFMYYEDADIGRRLLKISHSVYVPSVKIIHQWARGTHNNWRLRWITIKSGIIYFLKWGGIF
jgi:GT2 family glycosyltransferase